MQDSRPRQQLFQASGGILSKSHVRWLGESGQQPLLTPGASGLEKQRPEFPMTFQGSWVSDDEAHFWLNGYVNKQNCRIWSEANPQVYVETPLHPEKLTVWCALWAGGILLQKR
ncbi:hypothetical protein TNCV_88521 [Trichonephila clavipes]|nr:hypothetical protein TNCV_88521 [Trichonephila clavipes]